MRPTYDQVRTLFDYDAETGVLTRREYRQGGRGQLMRDVPGTTADVSTGYLKCNIDNKNWLAHRVIWLWMTGEWPAFRLDHKDTNRSNNVWTNLRRATQSENMGNARLSKANTSGYKGVSWCAARNKWQAQIKADGVHHQLGFFADKIDAAKAYDEASQRLFGQFHRNNFGPVRAS